MTLNDYVVFIRRELHQIPETGFNCPLTSQFIKNQLIKIGINEIHHTGHHSMVAVVKNGPGPITGLRADFDALNIIEETDLPFSSKNVGKMHACGHDAHSAMLLATAKYLFEHKDQWSGTVKLIFQEAEEGPAPGGALAIVESGLVDDVDEFFAIHVSPAFDASVLAINYGESMAAADTIQIEFIGKGCHAAMPNEGIDPILMQAEFIISAQTIITRKLSPMERAVITFAKVEAGTAHNVIPENATITGTVRTFNQETRITIKNELDRLASSIAHRYQGDYRLDYEFGYDPVINSQASVDTFIASAKRILGNDSVTILDIPTAGSEDFSRYINLKEGALAWLGVKHKDSKNYNIHHPKFTVNEDALMNGVNIFIDIIMRRSKNGIN